MRMLFSMHAATARFETELWQRVPNRGESVHHRNARSNLKVIIRDVIGAGVNH